MPTPRATPRHATSGEPEFPAWLAGLSDDALVRLLELRPDVATPPPATVDVLASRLRLPASTARALGSVDWPALLVLATAASLGADSGPVPVGALADRLGVDDDEESLRTSLDGLRDRALIWGAGSHVRLSAVTASAVESAPVVAPHPGEPTGAALEDARAALPERSIEVLGAIAGGRAPVGELGPGAGGRGPGRDHGDGGRRRREGGPPRTRAGPGQAGCAAGGGLPAGPAGVAQPRPGRKSGAVDASAGVAALELLHQCDAVLEALSTAPASTLKAGGVGVRELRRVARAAGVDRDDLPIILEALAAAGLIALGDTED